MHNPLHRKIINTISSISIHPYLFINIQINILPKYYTNILLLIAIIIVKLTTVFTLVVTLVNTLVITFCLNNNEALVKFQYGSSGVKN
jgi:hypothetical protein